MMSRFALLCLSLLLIVSGTASAARDNCPAVEAPNVSQVLMDMHGDCDMDMGAMQDQAPDGDMGHTGNSACCCPAIVAALPVPTAPDGPAAAFPPLFDTPLNTSVISFPSVPEPPPPRA